jgi:tRNA pseudouridine38-40 synthase
VNKSVNTAEQNIVSERLSGLRSIQLKVAYDGTDFSGWQRQKNARSVQEELEKALATMHGHPVNVTGAGRTDAGVHALGQVAGFATDIASIPAERFTLALNALLPRDLRVMDSCEASADFHARFDASMRTYRYFVTCAKTPSPMAARYSWFWPRTPHVSMLNAMASSFLGEHDFSAFASVKDKSLSSYRCVEASSFWFEGDVLVYQISANAFLWRMVRSLVGTMLRVSSEAKTDEEAGQMMSAILSSRERSAAGPTAPPQGLFLWSVEYGERTHGTHGPRA